MSGSVSERIRGSNAGGGFSPRGLRLFFLDMTVHIFVLLFPKVNIILETNSNESTPFLGELPHEELATPVNLMLRVDGTGISGMVLFACTSPVSIQSARQLVNTSSRR